MTVSMAQWKAPQPAPKKYLENCRPELSALPSRESSKVQATGHGRSPSEDGGTAAGGEGGGGGGGEQE